ncbi:lysylphosphatidylglycerol synthase transmembrane domain-containing protein [Cryomorphaceae bacterium 1068]|nr:lysylphosphatidylglycerol synthase transmembrane domain-containing protein [Cryomorphaceae bacterium 1068]
MFKAKAIQLLKIIIPVGLGIYLVWHIYNQLSPDQRIDLFKAFESANYFWVLLSFFMGLLSHWIRGYRWKFQLEAMGYSPSTTNNFMAVMIGYVVNLALPRVGEVSRAAALTKYEGVPFQKSFGSILSERALDFIILLIITFTTLLLQFELLEKYALEIISVARNQFEWPLISVGGIAVIALIALGFYLLKKFSHIPLVSKIRSFINELLEGLRSIVRMEKRWLYLLATLAIWGLYLAMFGVCFFALEETSSVGISAIFAGFVLGSFAIVIIPGGIGAFPAGIMQALMLYGISAESGFALGWILWFSQTIMIVLVGGLCMFLMPILNKNRLNEQTG